MESCGSNVAKLNSTDSLKSWRIVRLTEAKVNLFLRVKSVLLTHEELLCFLLCIKSKTFFKSSGVERLWGFVILD
jgi:hypothetical protein